ncbi:MAG: protein translocase subunit SecF [Clostridia bacterium]|jgi:preprotein translocase subunit SecF
MIDLMGKKYYFFALSAIIILAGAVTFFIRGGFNLDIQFKGGTIIEMQMTDKGVDEKTANEYKLDTAKAEKIVVDITKKNVTIQKEIIPDPKNGKLKVVLMSLGIASQDALSQTERQNVENAIIKAFELNSSNAIFSQNSYEPFIGKELLNNGLLAIFFASILIILYIWYRFKIMSGLSAGVMAILALIHDILLMLSVYLFFNIVVNEALIAAILTVIGYSMNDTIIIYDRIRENSSQLRKMPIGELVNRSIVETLNRSISTVVTVLICVTTVYVFARIYGIRSIQEFTLPLIIGVSSGCYSSIFIASPLWILWKESQEKQRLAARKATRG